MAYRNLIIPHHTTALDDHPEFQVIALSNQPLAVMIKYLAEKTPERTVFGEITFITEVVGFLPLVEQSARGLGVREGVDVTPDLSGYVNRNKGGISVAPYTPYNLQPHRLPRQLGGQSKDALFCINSANISFSGGLELELDSATHGLIGPNRQMKLGDFRSYLAATAPLWVKVLD